jgi:hypothetical protein
VKTKLKFRGHLGYYSSKLLSGTGWRAKGPAFIAARSQMLYKKKLLAATDY